MKKLLLTLLALGLAAALGVTLIMFSSKTDPCSKMKTASSPDECIELCAQCIESKALKGKELGETHVMLGKAFGKLGQHSKALQEFDKAIAADSTMAEAYSIRGLAYEKLGLCARAIEDQDKAIELSPKLAQAYTRRGVAHGRLGMVDEARQDFDKAAGIDPDNVEALCNRAYLLFTEYAQPREAIEDLSRAARGSGNDAKPHFGLGVVRCFQGLYSEAIDDFTKAIAFAPENAKAYELRSLVYQRLGKQEEARADFAKARQLDPTTTDQKF